MKPPLLLALLLASPTAATPIRAASAEQRASRTLDAAALRCPLLARYDPANPFGRIIRGDLPVSIVARNAKVMAFIPLGWDHPGHTLVVPTRAVRNLLDLNDDEMLAIMHMVKRVSVAQQRALGSTGFSLEQNNGSRQDVCHAHFHVIPNTPKQATHHATRDEMDVMAKRLSAALPAQ